MQMLLEVSENVLLAQGQLGQVNGFRAVRLTGIGAGGTSPVSQSSVFFGGLA